MAQYSYKSRTSVTVTTTYNLLYKTKHDSKKCCSLPQFFTPLLLSCCLLCFNNGMPGTGYAASYVPIFFVPTTF